MANYYVNSSADAGGNGTTTATTGANCAFKTIAQVNAASLSGDDFILFNKGQTWNVTLIPPSSGTSGHPITFGAYGTGAKPILSGSGLDRAVYDTAGRSYITFDGIEFQDGNYQGIRMTAAGTGRVVQNCTFTRACCALAGDDTIVQDNVFNGPTAGSGAGQDIRQDAITIYGSGISDNPIVRRNTIDTYNGRGIWFAGGTYTPTAYDNTISNISYTVGTTTEGYGINCDGYAVLITGVCTIYHNTISSCIRNGILFENCSEGSVVYNNLIHDCGSLGIVYINYNGGYGDQRGNHVSGQVYYNIIYHCLYGFGLQQVSGVDIWNNVVYDGAGANAAGFYIPDSGSYYVHNIDCRNNIFGGGTITRVAAMIGPWEEHFSVFDYNAVPTGTTFNQYSPTTVNHTLAQLQAESVSLNCFTTDPGFSNAAGHYFTLAAGSPCINAGTSVGLSADYLGNAVDGAPDIGAYEYDSGLPALNIRVHGRA